MRVVLGELEGNSDIVFKVSKTGIFKKYSIIFLNVGFNFCPKSSFLCQIFREKHAKILVLGCYFGMKNCGHICYSFVFDYPYHLLRYLRCIGDFVTFSTFCPIDYVQELRRQFSGAVPLGDQEKFSKAMLQLKQDKERMESQNKVVSSFFFFPLTLNL